MEPVHTHELFGNVTTNTEMTGTELYMPNRNKILLYAEGNYTLDSEPWMISVIFFLLQVLATQGALVILITMIGSSTFIMTYRIYLSLAAILDIFLVFIYGTSTSIQMFTRINPIYHVLLQSDISCRAYHVAIGFILHLSLWLHVALMIELYVIAVFPKKLNSTSSMERAHYMVLLLVTVFLIVNMNYFWTIKRQKEPLGLQPQELCYFESSFEQFATKIYPVIECTIIGALPMTVWIFLTAYTLWKYCLEGNKRPGGLLISTFEYYKISYAMCTLQLVGHLPRFIWLVKKYADYSWESEKNPGISTLQNFHTELLDGDRKINLVLACAISLRVVVLSAASSSFRAHLKNCVMRLCSCHSKSTGLSRKSEKSISLGMKMSHHAGHLPSTKAAQNDEIPQA